MTLMQKRFATLVALSVLLAVVTMSVIFQDKRQEASSEADKATKAVFTIAQDAVHEVRLQTPTQNFVVERMTDRDGARESEWRIVQPFKTPAEASTMEALVQAAIDLRSRATVRQNADMPADSNSRNDPDMALFGLGEPRYRLTLQGQDGNSQTLWVGKKNSYDNSLYVRRAQAPDVWVVPADFELQVDKDLYKLRDKRPLAATIEDVRQVLVKHRSGSVYELERQGHDWKLLQPILAGADETQVSNLLSALVGMRARTVAAEAALTPQERKPFGLHDPRTVVQLKVQRGDAAESIELLFSELPIGGDSHYFVMRDGRPAPVMELGSDWVLKKLDTSVNELRDLHVLHFEREAVQRIEMQRAGEPNGIAMNRTPDTDTWLLSQPPEGLTQSSKVAALLVRLGNLRADGVAVEAPTPADLEKNGLLQPFVTVRLLGAQQKVLATLLVGKKADDHYVAWGQDAAGTGRLDRLVTTAVDDLSTHAADYQEAATAKSN